MNGVARGTITAGTIALNSQPGNMGYDYWNGWYGAGYLSNVQIYNTSLDAGQISALYLKGIGAAPIAPQNCVGWWPLNGDVNDYSGNNNNGAATAISYTSSWTSGYTAP